jgi:mono/diheme cytochrome c family protein
MLAAAVAVPAGTPAARVAPKLGGNTTSGKTLFVSTCGVCHRLKAAGTVGVIGPNLDRVRLSQATIVKAVTNGGASVMTKAAAAKYSTRMTPYRNVLTKAQIQDVAAFVYAATRK